jgi:ABC-type multidrug transport system ATPase subunit
MTTPPPLHVRDLVCRYGDRLVLDRLSLDLHAGEILGVVGALGAGVSTLIKGILLLVAPRAGKVQVYAKPHALASSRALIAYLPEDVQTPGHLTGKDVISMARSIQGETTATSSIEELSIDLDLPLERLLRPTRDYSKEDVQKLGLIALLSTGRPILLLDQPMTWIGGSARAGLTRRLREHAARGGAVLLGAHDVAEPDGIADRLLTLKEGRLQADANDGPSNDAPFDEKRPPLHALAEGRSNPGVTTSMDAA